MDPTTRSNDSVKRRGYKGQSQTESDRSQPFERIPSVLDLLVQFGVRLRIVVEDIARYASKHNSAPGRQLEGERRVLPLVNQ